MTKIIMCGISGRMGRVIEGLVADDQDAEIVAGVDVVSRDDASFPIYKDINDCTVEADVIIDFSNPALTDALLDYSAAKKIPVVLCTTGLSEAQLAKVKETSEKVAVLKSGNMSLGINTIISLLKSAANVFCPAGFDVEIVEQHHHNKLDAPSGTALMLADAVNEARDGEFEYVYNRSDRRQARDKKELGISAVRAGSIPGIHEVIFAGPDEVIEIKHTAYSRTVFGNGAVNAAKFLKDKPAGLYDMKDVIAASLKI